jgi:hypothetical protein
MLKSLTDFTTHRLDETPDYLIYLALFLFSALVFALYGLELPLNRDDAQYFYSAERLLHGEMPMPYRSIFDMKTPLVSFVTALAWYVSQPLMAEPIMLARARAQTSVRHAFRMFWTCGRFAPVMKRKEPIT